MGGNGIISSIMNVFKNLEIVNIFSNLDPLILTNILVLVTTCGLTFVLFRLKRNNEIKNELKQKNELERSMQDTTRDFDEILDPISEQCEENLNNDVLENSTRDDGKFDHMSDETQSESSYAGSVNVSDRMRSRSPLVNDEISKRTCQKSDSATGVNELPVEDGSGEKKERVFSIIDKYQCDNDFGDQCDQSTSKVFKIKQNKAGQMWSEGLKSMRTDDKLNNIDLKDSHVKNMNSELAEKILMVSEKLDREDHKLADLQKQNELLVDEVKQHKNQLKDIKTKNSSTLLQNPYN